MEHEPDPGQPVTMSAGEWFLGGVAFTFGAAFAGVLIAVVVGVLTGAGFFAALMKAIQ